MHKGKLQAVLRETHIWSFRSLSLRVLKSMQQILHGSPQAHSESNLGDQQVILTPIPRLSELMCGMVLLSQAIVI